MACEDICPVGVEHSQLLAGAKAAQTMAIGTGSVASEFFKNITNTENPYAAQKDVRSDLIKDLNIPIYEKGNTEYLLWMGCIWSYNPDYKNIVKSTKEIFEKAGLSFGVLKSEKCSGHHSRRQGEEMQFQMFAEENSNMITENNVTKIITGCPHCMYSLRNEYSEYMKDGNLKIYHHSQIFSELVGKGALKLKSVKAESKTTYHDPCYLGRYEGEFEDPRKILKSVVGDIVETKQNLSKSYCCGGGAAGFTIEAKTEKRVDQERKNQINATGANTLVTGCPECRLMLNGAVEKTKDISEILLESLI